MVIQTVLLQTVSGLCSAMVYFLIAAGLSIILGTLKVLNIAHAALYLLGAFLSCWLTSTLGGTPGAFWWTLILTPLILALVGCVLEVVLFRRLYDVDMLYQLTLCFGLILALGEVIKLIWGVGYHMVSTPWPLNGSVSIMGALFPKYNLFTIAMGGTIFAGLEVLMHYTTLGRNIRAVTYSRDMASTLGINTPLIYTVVFMLGCWLAGVAGVLMSAMIAVGLGQDTNALVYCFIILVTGGFGSLPGAFIAAIILGLITSFGILLVPNLAIAFGFLLMAIVLVFRPYGLMGRPEQ